jgi:hypothetical protein
MGHIQQLAFALGPAERQPTAPARSRPTGRPSAGRIAPDPSSMAPDLLTSLAPGPTRDAPATEPSPAVFVDQSAPAPSLPASRSPLTDATIDSMAAQPALYLVVGLVRKSGRQRAGWQRIPDRVFTSRRLAENHGARLLASGRADGVVLLRQTQTAESEGPDILARFGELPEDLADD